MPKTLKAKNLKFIVIMLIADTAILTLKLLSDKISSLLAPNNWLFCLAESATKIMIAALLINKIFSPNLKAVIVFWRLWNVLPGYRTFSKFVHRDSRIDINTLEKKLGTFSKAVKEQTAL